MHAIVSASLTKSWGLAFTMTNHKLGFPRGFGLVLRTAFALVLRLSIWVNDRLILYRFSLAREICQDKNLGAAFCLAGSCIACGLILNGVLVGYSKSFAYGLRDIVIFWLLGQAILVIGAFAYQRITKYDVHELIEYDDNVAVGIGFGAFLAGLGIVVRASLVGAGLASLGTDCDRCCSPCSAVWASLQ
jgi:uncharacterized membrane protein YjfL (UPF0719 family)